jgi:F420-dependent methylenetetrahydromethanopterin dehydrogenase
MTLEASVLRPDAVRATAAGYEVDVRLPWYRSLPLSCLEDVTVTVDGTVAARADVTLRHEGRELHPDDLADLVDEQWFVQDPLTVLVPDPAPATAGAEADVSVHVAVRIPYIIIGPGTALVQRTEVERKVVVR